MEPIARNRNLAMAVSCTLLLAVAVVFGQTVGHDFVNYDDNVYVTNHRVTGELSWAGIVAAFTQHHIESGAPLTCVSHMLVWHLLGHGPGVHHLVNTLLHAAAAVTLLWVLWQMTGQWWPSALAAAVFAVHPLRAESVAWVTELKDVLSGLFFMLTLLAYFSYVRRPSAGRYLAVCLYFAVSLAAKPIAVTLPFLLLLLDYWPFGRISLQGGADIISTQGGADILVCHEESLPRRLIQCLRHRLVLEKIPLLAVAVVFCLLAVRGQGTEALAVNQRYSIPWRLGNAMISYATYLVQFFVPVGLAPACPRRPTHLPYWELGAALLVLAAVTWLALSGWRKRPYLAVGWLWYLGMFVPVIGIVQFGAQAEADRFTYLPCIGLCIALAWGVAEACRCWSLDRRWCGVGVAVVLAALMVGGWRQTRTWRTSESLWSHAIACSPGNPTAWDSLGNAWADEGRVVAAIPLFEQALKLDPKLVGAYNNLGGAWARCGQVGEAMKLYGTAISLEPKNAEAHHNLGNALTACNQIAEATKEYLIAEKLEPESPEIRYHLADVLAKQGQVDEAKARYKLAIMLQPGNPAIHVKLGDLLASCGQLDDAVAAYHDAIVLNPDFAEAHNNLGQALLHQGHVGEAIRAYRKAIHCNPNFVVAYCNLGDALVAEGHFDQAAAEYQKALRLGPKNIMALRSMAWLRATCSDFRQRDGGEAVELAERARDLSQGKLPAVLDALAAAYAEARRFDEAIVTARRAIELAHEQHRDAQAAALRIRLSMYEARLPYRQ